MKQFTYTITDPVGIHARPAGVLAKQAKALDSTVTIAKADGKSAAGTLIAMLDDLQGRGMMRGSWREHIAVADTLDDVKKIISNH